MKKLYILSAIVAILVGGCKKDPSSPAPEAGFSIGDDGKSLLIMNQRNFFSPLNTSSNATSYLWDLGNNITSTEKTPSFSMVIPGTYDISLRASNKDGQVSVYKRQIKIVVPILKAITIKKIHWEKNIGLSPDLPNFSKADVWVEIVKMDSKKSYNTLSDGSSDAPLFYKSSVYKDAVSGNAPIVFAVTEKVVLSQVEPSGVENKYEMKLFAKDASGTYLVYSSRFIGSYYTDNPLSGIYLWSSDFAGSSVEVKAAYE